MKKSNEEIKEQALEFINSSKYIKAGTIVVLSLVGLYLLGHVFKISAHAVRGYKDLKSALKAG